MASSDRLEGMTPIRKALQAARLAADAREKKDAEDFIRLLSEKGAG